MQLAEESILYDLGCGDGRLLTEAVKASGARGVCLYLRSFTPLGCLCFCVCLEMFCLFSSSGDIQTKCSTRGAQQSIGSEPIDILH